MFLTRDGNNEIEVHDYFHYLTKNDEMKREIKLKKVSQYVIFQLYNNIDANFTTSWGI